MTQPEKLLSKLHKVKNEAVFAIACLGILLPLAYTYREYQGAIQYALLNAYTHLATPELDELLEEQVRHYEASGLTTSEDRSRVINLQLDNLYPRNLRGQELLTYFESLGYRREQLAGMAKITTRWRNTRENKDVGASATAQIFIHHDERGSAPVDYFIIIFSGHQVKNAEGLTHDYTVTISRPDIFLAQDAKETNSTLKIPRTEVGLKYYYQFYGPYFNDVAAIAIPVNSTVGQQLGNLYPPDTLDSTDLIGDKTPRLGDQANLACWTWKASNPLLGQVTRDEIARAFDSGGLKIAYRGLLTDPGVCGCVPYASAENKYVGVVNGNYLVEINPAGPDVVLLTPFSRMPQDREGLPLVITQAIDDQELIPPLSQLLGSFSP